MSYDIRLTDPVTHEPLILDTPHDMRGGTYCVGGTKEAWLNITYNYAVHYHRIFEPVYRPENECAADERDVEYGREIGYLYGIRSIYGMTGAESIPVLKRAASMLSDETDPDYWEPTEGNAKRPLLQLIALAQLRPDGVWNGD